ncbi:hypothetical protein C4J88_3506 [Pseudomonas sp. R4-39-08]|uniref:hypothetical protein n=1 Tax=Pseudomonas sp. R4-39-08 TaxID=1173288 RepID=UPI000F578AB6|nr:hypothetical protein [Pseudomonas sp. R4-39-08]AZF38280.1 hypothetical protein C4J88_3506 [Pseudomonas sp. R4-39-08]
MRPEAGLGNVRLQYVFNAVVVDVSDSERAIAITAALQIRACGLTYASKILTFLRPKQHA